MATLAETIWVHNRTELDSTVARLVAQGGVVQNQTEDSVDLYLKKKMNLVVLIVGLILCLVPGIAYLIWYSTADQSQAISVKIGSAPTLGGYHPDQEAGSKPTEGSAPPSQPSAAAPPAAAPPAAAPPAADSTPPETAPPAT